MTRKEYLAALEVLGLSRAGQRTAKVLGCSVRQLIRYARADKKRAPIPDVLALLLRCYQADPQLMEMVNRIESEVNTTILLFRCLQIKPKLIDLAAGLLHTI